MSYAPRYVFIAGTRFGRGVVVKEVRLSDKKASRAYQMLCDCGTVYASRPGDLATGSSQSCGCLAAELASARMTSPEGRERLRRQAASPVTKAATAASNTRNKTTHGLSHTHPLYSTWCGMMNRCFNEKQPGYPNYGARGITVCERWRDVRNFVEDIEREIGPKPDPKLTLDRIENDGNYEPGNVRWATRKEQQANKRAARPGHGATSQECGSGS